MTLQTVTKAGALHGMYDTFYLTLIILARSLTYTIENRPNELHDFAENAWASYFTAPLLTLEVSFFL